MSLYTAIAGGVFEMGSSFQGIDKILILGGMTEPWAIIVWNLDLSDIPWFPKILSIKSLGKLYMLFLLLIITLRFTCGERKVW